MNEAIIQTSSAAVQTPYTPEGTDVYPPFYQGGRFAVRRGAVGAADGVDYRHQGQHDLRAEGRGGAGRLVDDGDEYCGLEVPARADWDAGAGDRCAATGGPGGGDGAGLGSGQRLLCDGGRRARLPRRAGAHAADAEGGVQLAGVVQRGLRPAGAGFGRAELALGPGDGRGEVLGDGLPESAVLGVLYQRGGRLAGLDSDAGQDRGHAVQVGFGHGDESVVDSRVDGAAVGRRAGIGAVELHARVRCVCRA